jgi:hypothetical protein
LKNAYRPFPPPSYRESSIPLGLCPLTLTRSLNGLVPMRNPV